MAPAAGCLPSPVQSQTELRETEPSEARSARARPGSPELRAGSYDDRRDQEARGLVESNLGSMVLLQGTWRWLSQCV